MNYKNNSQNHQAQFTSNNMNSMYKPHKRILKLHYCKTCCSAAQKNYSSSTMNLLEQHHSTKQRMNCEIFICKVKTKRFLSPLSHWRNPETTHQEPFFAYTIWLAPQNTRELSEWMECVLFCLCNSLRFIHPFIWMKFTSIKMNTLSCSSVPVSFCLAAQKDDGRTLYSMQVTHDDWDLCQVKIWKFMHWVWHESNWKRKCIRTYGIQSWLLS